MDTGVADAGEFDLCGGRCPRGTRCQGFRCVADGDGGREGGVDAGAVFDLGEIAPTACCPVDPPSCGCVRIGGPRRSDGNCPMVCGEGIPQAWIRIRDRNGCQVWLPSGIACSDLRDAGASVDATGQDDRGGGQRFDR